MLRPLLVGETVGLFFEEPVGIPPIYGDEGKVSQILRNFLSNALKFTERGEIRVRAALDASGQQVTIAVSDTGIGIAPADQARIFEEFAQVEHVVQKKVKGTGLGLALSRRLAEVLGGGITLESEPGRGSTFFLHLPVAYAPPPALAVETQEVDPRRIPVLVVDDDPVNLSVYDRVLRGSEFQILAARTIREAEAWLATGQPRAAVLDIQLLGEDSWGLLAEIKGRPGPAVLPVVVVTSVDDERKALALGADAYRTPPVEGEWLLGTLRELAGPAPRSVLIVDDDEASRLRPARPRRAAGPRRRRGVRRRGRVPPGGGRPSLRDAPRPRDARPRRPRGAAPPAGGPDDRGDGGGRRDLEAARASRAGRARRAGRDRARQVFPVRSRRDGAARRGAATRGSGGRPPGGRA
jgi:CheY-like chemotaxis protein/anti-sigma regulatory factor (Ser/Thr protein kinase)